LIIINSWICVKFQDITCISHIWYV
jgi:hypothetical protein